MLPREIDTLLDVLGASGIYDVDWVSLSTARIRFNGETRIVVPIVYNRTDRIVSMK
jgi:hypothetical protein